MSSPYLRQILRFKSADFVAGTSNPPWIVCQNWWWSWTHRCSFCLYRCPLYMKCVFCTKCLIRSMMYAGAWHLCAMWQSTRARYNECDHVPKKKSVQQKTATPVAQGSSFAVVVGQRTCKGTDAKWHLPQQVLELQQSGSHLWSKEQWGLQQHQSEGQENKF